MMTIEGSVLLRPPPVRRGVPRAASVVSSLALLAVLGCGSHRTAGVGEYYAGNAAAAEEAYRTMIEREPNSRALYLLLLGTVELDRGDVAEARERFIEATRIMESFKASGEFEAVVGAESSKEYKGDPYERMMAWWYLGLLDFMLGDYDMALPSFKSAVLADAGGRDERFYGDTAAALLFLGLTYRALGQDERAASEFAEAAKANHARDTAGAAARSSGAEGDVPPLTDTVGDLNGNFLVVVGLGRGPYKYETGVYGEAAAIARCAYPERQACISVDGRPVGRTVAVEDVFYQAATRGGRAMDAVLAGKAIFKGALEVAAEESFEDSAETDAPSEKRRRSFLSGLALAVMSLFVRPEADTRSWETLPDEIQVLSANISSGKHIVEAAFLDQGGNEIPGMRIHWEDVTFSSDRRTVLYVRSGHGGAWRDPPMEYVPGLREHE